MLGVDRAHLVKQPLTAFVAPQDQDNSYFFHRQLLSTKTRQVRELRMARRDGSHFHALVEGIAAEVGAGMGLVCRTTVSDITERKRTEAALQEYSERMAEMLEARSEDLKHAHEDLASQEHPALQSRLARSSGYEPHTPLPGIYCAPDYLDTALDGTGAAGEPVEEWLRAVSSSIRYLQAVFADLLDLARGGSTEKQQSAIAALAYRALARCPVPANVNVIVELPPGLPLVSACPDYVDSVLTRLIRSTFRTMAEGGELRIGATAEPHQVHVSTWHTCGCGSPEQADRFYEPTLAVDAQVAGLELALVASLAEVAGGLLKVEGKQGAGSMLTLTPPTGAADSNGGIERS